MTLQISKTLNYFLIAKELAKYFMSYFKLTIILRVIKYIKYILSIKFNIVLPIILYPNILSIIYLNLLIVKEKSDK